MCRIGAECSGRRLIGISEERNVHAPASSVPEPRRLLSEPTGDAGPISSAAVRSASFLARSGCLCRRRHNRRRHFHSRCNLRGLLNFKLSNPANSQPTEDPEIPAAAPILNSDIESNEVDGPVVSSEEFPVVADPEPVQPKEAEEDDEDDEDDEEEIVPVFPVFKKGQRMPTFFPMQFGSTSGGSIAVANSFSMGKGGAASHAIAYGGPGGKKNREV